MQNGDVYFWRWNDAELEKRLKHNSGSYSLTYWCRSQKAIVRNGFLIDTYWHDLSADKALNPELLTLEYKGNESTLRPINHWEEKYYEPDDVVDMRHPNDTTSGKVYVKPDAKRSQARILEHLNYVREKELAAIKCANWSIESIDKQIAEVNAGILDKVSR